MSTKNRTMAAMLRRGFLTVVVALLVSAHPHAPTGSAQSLSPALPAKEYVYANAKLLAVEVPERPHSLVFSGAETGDMSEVSFFDGNTTIASDIVNTGNYAFELRGSSTETGKIVFEFPPTDRVWVSFYVYLPAPANGGPIWSGGLFYLRAANMGGLAYVSVQPYFGDLDNPRFHLTTPTPLYPTPTNVYGQTIVQGETWYHLEVMYQKGSGTDSITQMRVNGNVEATVASGEATVDAVAIEIFKTHTPTYVDDVRIYDNKYPGAGYVYALRPNAPGDEDYASGSFADIDDDPINDSTFRVAPGIGPASFLNRLTVLLDTGTVNGVRVAVRASRTGGQSRTHYIRALRPGSTAEDGPPLNLTQSVKYYEFTPSASSQPRGRTELNAYQIGVNQSNAGGQKYECSEAWLMVDYSP